MATRMKMNGNDISSHEWLKSVGKFLAKYASTMLSIGSTTIRIEKNIDRIARRFGATAEITVMPMHVTVTVWDNSQDHSYTINEKTKGSGIDFDKNTLLSKLSWEIFDNNISLEDAKAKFADIISRKRMSLWLVTALTGLANASFCRLFGGDAISMLIVFIATVNGFYLKHHLHNNWEWDLRISTILSGCLATIIASAGYVFHIGSTPDIALGTGVLYLVPGVPFINAISDLIHGHYICFLSRFIQATIITICLSLGLCLGFIIVNIHVL